MNISKKPNVSHIGENVVFDKLENYNSKMINVLHIAENVVFDKLESHNRKINKPKEKA